MLGFLLRVAVTSQQSGQMGNSGLEHMRDDPRSAGLGLLGSSPLASMD